VEPSNALVRSLSHPRAKLAHSLARGVRERREAGLFLVEGTRGLEEALVAGARISFVLVAAGKAALPAFRELLQRCQRDGIPVEKVQDALHERIAPAEAPPGLLAACALPAGCDRPETVISAAAGLLPVAFRIQNPGSVGTLVRSATAFGADGLLALGGADPWGPKAVRASAGAIHRLPVARAEPSSELLEPLRTAGFRLIAAMPRGGRPPDALDWSGRIALLLGAEVAGLPSSFVEYAETVTIPVSGAVESLSVPVAGSILLAMAAISRQRAPA